MPTRVQGERAGGGVQPGIAPRRVAEPEKMSPLRRLEGDGAARGRRGFRCLPRADQDHRERGMRLGEALVQLDGAARVRDGVGKQRVAGLRVEPRALVEGKLRGGETGVREGVTGVGRDGAREIRHRAWEGARVEGLDLSHPSVHAREASRLEVSRTASRETVREGGRPRACEKCSTR